MVVVLYGGDVAPLCLQPMLSLEPTKMIVQICKCMISATKFIHWNVLPLYGRGVSTLAFLVVIAMVEERDIQAPRLR